MENGHYHRCVVVEGPPGIGKSTLAWLIGKRWCDRSMFDDLGILVHLKLRDRSVREASQLSELFRHPDPHVTAAVVATVAAVGGKGSVLMLDGFDEQAVDLQGKSLIAKVIRGNELPGVTLIITARPSSSQTLFRFRQGCGFQDQLIEVLGFRKREVDTYIDRLLRANGTLLDSFRRYIGCHPHTYSLMSVPMYCAMLVEMYTNHSGVGKPIPRTITDLYVAFTQVLLVLHEKDEAEQGKMHSDCVKLSAMYEIHVIQLTSLSHSAHAHKTRCAKCHHYFPFQPPPPPPPPPGAMLWSMHACSSLEPPIWSLLVGAPMHYNMYADNV